MPDTPLPLSLIQVTVVVVAPAQTVPSVVFPLPAVLVISRILPVFCYESALTFTDTFDLISIAACRALTTPGLAPTLDEVSLVHVAVGVLYDSGIVR